MVTIEADSHAGSLGPLPYFFKRMQYFVGQDMAMDLGTANTLIYIKNQGIVLNEPSMVCVEEDSNKVVAIGHAAKELFGKTSTNLRCFRPMKDGVISDFEKTTAMIEFMLGKVCSKFSLYKPRIVVGVPSGITQVEKRAVIDSALNAGIREVLLVDEPMAAALGANLPVHKALGNMIIDIGGGTTEVAILGMNSTLYSHSIRVAGDEMDTAIQSYLRREYGLHVGIFEAERLKIILGTALAQPNPKTTLAYGRDTISGFPRQLEVSEDMVRKAMDEPLGAIISSVVNALEQTSPEIAHDIVTRGICLAGGGTLLRGLPERLNRDTGVTFYRAEDPLSCVVRGVGKVIDNLRDLKSLCIT